MLITYVPTFRSLVGYLLAYATYLPVIRHHNKIRAEDPDKLSPESRLWWLLFRKSFDS